MSLPRVSERVVQAHIVQLLRSLGGRVYVLGTTRRRGDYAGTMQTPGLGDLYCFLPSPPLRYGHPCAVWVEVKAAGGRLRDEQQTFRDECFAAYVPHVVGDLDAVIRFLMDGGWLKPESVAHYRQPRPAAGATEIP